MIVEFGRRTLNGTFELYEVQLYFVFFKTTHSRAKGTWEPCIERWNSTFFIRISTSNPNKQSLFHYNIRIKKKKKLASRCIPHTAG